MQNPLSMLKNIDLSGLNKILTLVHENLEAILKENITQTKQNEEIIKLLEQIKNKDNIPDIPIATHKRP